MHNHRLTRLKMQLHAVEFRVITGMASQALLRDLFRCCFRESEDLGRIPAALHMSLTGSMTTLACHSFAAVLEC